MLLRTFLVTALGAALVLVACKHTVEGENKTWDSNVKRINELTAIYPGFAPALHEQQKRAEDAMSAAQAISNAEEAAKKMAEANSLAAQGFVSTLGQLDSRTRQLREKLITANGDATPGGDAAARIAADDAQRILRNIDDALKTGAPTADAASAMLGKMDRDLASANSNIDRVISAARQRKQDAAKAGTGAAAASGAAAAVGAAPGTTGAAAPAAAPAEWKCAYCDHMNADSRMSCEKCGAPRPKAKKK